MSSCTLLPLLIFFGVLLALTPLLGSYIVRVFSGSVTCRPLRALELTCYRIGNITPHEEMSCWAYGKAWLICNVLGVLFVFCVALTQKVLPLNPQGFCGTSWPLAFNIAVSFATNTNWQSYAGETTLSYFTQMVALTSQNFLSAASGMCALIAFIRGLTKKAEHSLGNFYVDFVRIIVYLLLPLSIGLAVVLTSQGVIQTFSPYITVETIEGNKQTIPLGPVASQVAIKQLGTNGGGFFNANSAHPFENPSIITNVLENFFILLIPASLVYAYGVLIGSKKHGWLLLFVMVLLYGSGLMLSVHAEGACHPITQNLYPNKPKNRDLGLSKASRFDRSKMGPYSNIDPFSIVEYRELLTKHKPDSSACLGIEGKETRFGTMNSVLWAVSTTATANGSVNCMHDSLSPITGGVAMFNMMLGELIFGGVGVGMCTMIMFVLLTVFLAGLMVGRTPEYLGKKIEKREIQLVTISVLSPGALILIGAGISSILPAALSSLGNNGPHGLSEILYAFTSASNNNGSAFAGLNTNTTYYNMLLGIIMLLGRAIVVFPSLAIAGLLVQKKITPPSLGTFSTNAGLFVVLLIGVILIVGALTFFPALSLGPIVEHLLMTEGRSF